MLRPDGRLAIATTPPEMQGTPAAPEPMASIGRFYTDEELAALAVEAGFADVSVAREGRGSQLLTRVRRASEEALRARCWHSESRAHS